MNIDHFKVRALMLLVLAAATERQGAASVGSEKLLLASFILGTAFKVG